MARRPVAGGQRLEAGCSMLYTFICLTCSMLYVFSLSDLSYTLFVYVLALFYVVCLCAGPVLHPSLSASDHCYALFVDVLDLVL